MAITVPGTQRLLSAKPNHRGTVVYYESADVRRVIPEAKVAAVKAALFADCDSRYGIDYGGVTATARDGRGFRADFKAMKTEAQVTTFLAAVETAITV